MKMKRRPRVVLLILAFMLALNMGSMAFAAERENMNSFSIASVGTVSGTIESDIASAPGAKDISEAPGFPGEDTETGNAQTRYLVVGGIVLAVGIGFYVFLSVKTKRK